MSGPGPSPGGRWAWVWWVVAVGLIAAGAAVLGFAVGDVGRASSRAGATPVRVLEPAGPPVPPAIVLAHGFSGSAAMVDPLGSTLARAGHLVVLPELPGHGANSAPLADGSLEPAIADAVALAAERTGQAVAVVGHSMGAGAVTSWALAGEPASTVAISLPSADELPPFRARPANLLLLWGSAEQQRFVDAALQGLRIAWPAGAPEATYGSFPDGTARRASEIAGAEHVAVLYRAETAREVAAWVASAPVAPGGAAAVLTSPGAAAGEAALGDARIVGLLLVLLGGLLATRPFLSGSTGFAVPDPTRAVPVGVRATIGRCLLAAVAAGLGGKLLGGLGERVPVAVGGYLLAWFGVGALVLAFAGVRRGSAAGTARGLLRGLAAGAILAACLALPARLAWASFTLVGPRWWVFGVLLVVLGGWCWAESRLVLPLSGWGRAVALAASRLVVVAGLLGAVLWLGAPQFLTLTVPLMIPILALLGVVAHWARDPLAAAGAQAVPLALTVATTFPILG